MKRYEDKEMWKVKLWVYVERPQFSDQVLKQHTLLHLVSVVSRAWSLVHGHILLH